MRTCPTSYHDCHDCKYHFALSCWFDSFSGEDEALEDAIDRGLIAIERYKNG